MKFLKLRSILVAVLAAFALSGCAQLTGYDKYLEQVSSLNKQEANQAELRIAQRNMDNQRIAEIAASGSDAVKIAAAMSIMTSNIVADTVKGNGGGNRVVVPQAPKDPIDSFVQLLGIAAPVAGQVYAVKKNADVAIAQSNNSRLVEESRNLTFSNIATAGFNGMGNIATSGFNALATVNPQPNITVNAGGDAAVGDNNTFTRRNCTGGNATATGGNAAPGGNGGAGAPSGSATGQPAAGGIGGASGSAGTGTATAGNASC
jgi:hypothetical protein